MPISLTTINTDEVLRYMGTPPDQAGADLRALAETCAQEVLSAARPRWAYRVFDLTPQAEGVRLDCGLLLPGEDLKRHLKDCRRAALFCATLSAQVDALIRRAGGGDMLRALAPGRGVIGEFFSRQRFGLQGRIAVSLMALTMYPVDILRKLLTPKAKQ